MVRSLIIVVCVASFYQYQAYISTEDEDKNSSDRFELQGYFVDSDLRYFQQTMMATRLNYIHIWYRNIYLQSVYTPLVVTGVGVGMVFV